MLTVAGDSDWWREIGHVRTHAGSVLAPFEAWLLIRGMRTLFVRFARQSETAIGLARMLERHDKVEAVLYPGLPGHAGHNIASRQMTGGFGGMLSILVKGGAEEARRVATSTNVFIPATSLGGVESLIEHRRSVQSPDSVVADNLLRLSIGIEAPDDLASDLRQALDKI